MPGEGIWVFILIWLHTFELLEPVNIMFRRVFRAGKPLVLRELFLYCVECFFLIFYSLLRRKLSLLASALLGGGRS